MTLPSHFYGIVDPIAGHEPVALAETLLDAGAKILQLRLKNFAAGDFVTKARMIASLCRERSALLIVNDRLDIALLAEAGGVHLGQTDLPLDSARSLAGPDRVIGISTHSVAQARAAELDGASYIGFGPIYPGGTKDNQSAQGLERLRIVRAAVRVPIVAIGGITEATVIDVLHAGADAVAIIGDVVRASDSVAKVRAILALHQRVDN